MSEIARRRDTRLERANYERLAEGRRADQLRRAWVEDQENLAAYEVGVRLANGYQLTAQAEQHMNALNRSTTQACRDNPGLEMAHRELEQMYVAAAQQLIFGYMSRPRKMD